MTILSLLGGDWTYEFEDENVNGLSGQAGTRMLRYVTGAVRTTNEVYSALAAEIDEFVAMGFLNAMLPVTPNAYTMENKAFISRASTEFLREGTINADWSLVGSAGNDSGRGVVRKEYDIVTDFVSDDIGRRVVESASSDTGTLLDFEVEPDGTTIAWIRPDDSTPTTGDIFDATSGTISCTADGGTGTNNVTIASTSGTNQYTAIQAIGSVPTATEVYIVQDRVKLGDSLAAFQFWVTDPTVSLGIISVLIRTENSGITIADGDLEVFARRYTSLYDNFRLNVAAGGFSALPLASAPDINNTTGYFAAVWSNGGGTEMFVGDVLDNTTGGKEGGSYVVTAVADSTGTGTFEYYEVGDLTAFASADTFTSANRTGDINGAPTANVGGPTETGAGNGATVTITLGHILADHDGSGTTEPYSVDIDAQGPGGNGVPVATVYEVIKYRTRRGSDAAGLFGAGVNVPGETYRGADAQVFYDAPSASMVEGDDLDGQGGHTSRLLSDNETSAGEGTLQDYVILMDQQTSLDAVANDDDLTDESANTVTVDTGGAGGAIQAITSPKSSPFGTFTGSQLFGARCILFSGQADADTQAYTLNDDNGTQRVSPNTVTFTVTNTLALDRVLVARDTGTSGVIDKDQFGGMTAVAASSKTITVAGTVDAEVPTAGFVRVVETTLQQEHKYEYASRTTGASGVFTLIDITASTANDTGSTTTPTNLNDSTASFETEGVKPGMLIQDTTNGDTYEVLNLVSGFEETRINILQIFGTGGTLATGDDYTINETIQLYATGDDLYDLILDLEAIGTTESNTFVQSTSFDTVVNVRQGKVILPFTQNQSVGASGATVTVVRQPDTIAV